MSELTRRGIMGAIGGAVAAGPALAKSIVSEVAAVNSAIGLPAALPDYMGQLNEAKIMKDVAGGSWSSQRLRDIKEQLRAGMQPVALSDYDRQQISRTNLKGMKSISPVNQHRMHIENANRREAENRSNYLKREMLELLGLRRETKGYLGGENAAGPIGYGKDW